MAGAASADRVVVIGAGMGGLAAAIDLARRGVHVTVLERAATVGGKMRRVATSAGWVDAGPTVLTMRSVFEALFADAGAGLDDYVSLQPLATLGRHAWSGGESLDLFVDPRRSEDAIGNFAGALEAEGFRRFRTRARKTHAALEDSFIRASRPNVAQLVLRCAPGSLGDLLGISPFTTLWRDLAGYFRDPRLRQMFGRYATYCGASPFLAPATLMLIAHVEQMGVWAVDGGMHALAQALEKLARGLGVEFRFGAHVAGIEAAGGRARAILLADGGRLEASSIVCNADCAALVAGLFGDSVRSAVKMKSGRRSLSALTGLCAGQAHGLDLVRHNTFFNEDYPAEFDDIFAHGRLPQSPTVYLCAQDRLDGPPGETAADERLFWLVNAPATGDAGRPEHEEIERCRTSAMAVMRSCGLEIEPAGETTITGPKEFEALFPATGGALYGQATHGWRASFQRPGSRTRLPGLYLAGGSAHPGAGVPIATLSGRLAAEALMQDLASRARSRRAAMPGGMSTRSATTGGSA